MFTKIVLIQTSSSGKFVEIEMFLSSKNLSEIQN